MAAVPGGALRRKEQGVPAAADAGGDVHPGGESPAAAGTRREEAGLTHLSQAGEHALEDLHPVERLLRLQCQDAYTPIADALWRADSAGHAFRLLEELAAAELAGWLAGDGRGYFDNDRDKERRGQRTELVRG